MDQFQDWFCSQFLPPCSTVRVYLEPTKKKPTLVGFSLFRASEGRTFASAAWRLASTVRLCKGLHTHGTARHHLAAMKFRIEPRE